MAVDPTLDRLAALIGQGGAIEVKHETVRNDDWLQGPVQVTSVNREAYQRWRTSCLAFLDTLIPAESIHREIVDYFKQRSTPSEEARDALLAQFKAVRDIYCEGHLPAVAAKPSAEPLAKVRLLCERFHAVAHQLRTRRHETVTVGKGKNARSEKRPRATLEVNDEYDAQDLMHGLLRIYFDDIRPEDPASRLAGAPSRTDFVLGGHGIVLELKRTRSGLGDKEVGEQLLVDIARYRSHPECKTLVCFVYDPDGLLSNPVELEKSLSGVKDGLPVELLIFPRR